MINSGDLKLIENVQLRATSQGHYPSHEKLDNIYIKHTSLIRDYLRDYIINHADYDQISLSKSPFIDELKLKNIVRTLTTMFVDK